MDLSLSVTFATPTLGEVAVEHENSMRQTMLALGQHGIPFNFIDDPGIKPIKRARNGLATAFLDYCKNSQNLFFTDADVGGWPPLKVIEFLKRPEPIIIGVPRMQDERLWYPCNYRTGPESKLIWKDGLVLADRGPAGFMRIKREALEKIAAECGTFMETLTDGTDHRIYDIFEDGTGADEKFWGEDFTFIRKAMSMDMEVWIDPDIEFSHRGSYAFRGKLADVLNKTT